MPSNIIDFHCHLDLFPEFPELVRECETRKIYTLTMTTTPRAWKRNHELTNTLKFVRAALGLHPQLVAKYYDELELFRQLVPGANYIGEIGIDGSREYADSLALQINVFEQILDICAVNGGRVMSIHARGAVSLVLDSIERNPKSGTPILHWFSGTSQQLQRAIDLGCWFSVGPKMLQGSKGLDLAAEMPVDRLLTETDGPFATEGGQPLYPWAAERATRKLAELWGVDIMKARIQLGENLARLTRIPTGNLG